MIICNSKRFIFIHIPKCAGTSVTRALAPSCRWNDIVLGSTDFGTGIEGAYKKKFGLEKHSTVRDVVNVVGEEVWSEYFTFTIVRNPLHRIVSWYTFARKLYDGQNYLRRMVPWLYRLFEKPLKSRAPVVKAYQESRSFSDFLRHEGCFGDDGTLPQLEWMRRETDSHHIPLDYVGHLESIEADFQHICRRIGVDASLSRHNSSRSGTYSQFYSSRRDIEIVLDRYAEDFNRLSYEKKLAR